MFAVTVCIIVTLKGKRNKLESTKSSSSSNQATRSVLTVIIFYLATTTPVVAARLLNMIPGLQDVMGIRHTVIGDIIGVNDAANCYLYIFAIDSLFLDESR